MARRRRAKTAGAGRSPRRRKPQPRRRARLFALLRRLAAGLLLLAVLLAGAFIWLAPELPDPRALVERSKGVRITLLAADGAILAERGLSGRVFLRLGEISPWLVKAVLATEDRRFFEHPGFDPLGILRALIANLGSGRYVAGGSTITQQLAKNLYLSPERSLRRKLREFVLALWLEARLSKTEILELYLNRVYFGAGAYGAAAAARTYFGKSARDLDLAESAMLAGLLKAPSRYAPTRNPARARERAATVLGLMVRAGFISEAEAERARAHPAMPRRTGGRFAGHFVDRVLTRIARRFPHPEQDLVVRTTLDPALQRRAEETLNRALAPYPALQGAVVAVDAAGAVRAYVGGRGREGAAFDRAGAVRRQPGSAFKLFVYAAAFERGARPSDVIDDRPLTVAGWSPRNHDGRYRGAVTLEQAFALSLNAATVRLAQRVGIPAIVAVARACGIASPLTPVPSLALGTSEVTPLELTGAYATVMRGGVHRPPRLITRVADATGRVLARPTSGAQPVLAPDSAAALDRLLAAVVAYGTGRQAALPGRRVRGKTGTSQGPRDAWFVGYAGDVAIGVWVGRDDGRPIGRISGGTLPARIFRDILRALPASEAPVARLSRGRSETAAGNRSDTRRPTLFEWLQERFGG